MQGRFIIVTDADMDRLTRLVRALKCSLFRDPQQVELLDQTLEKADVRPPSRVPRDVIRMNSRVRVLDLDVRQKELYTLVFPEEANISRGLISVLAPIGIALVGHRQGDVVEARVPGGIRKLRVDQVRPRAEVAKEKPSEDKPVRRASHPVRTHQTALVV
jgi:regulator of nucleoside diphosphate kinase